MTSRDFCYWLQGYFEIGAADKNKGSEALSYQQTEVIKNHLAMVFKHEIDPSFGGPATLKDLHDLHRGAGGQGGITGGFPYDPNTTLVNC